MDIMIEGWEPTPLEKSLMDGSFDKRIITEGVQENIPDDLLQVQNFEDAIADLKNEVNSWQY